MKPFAIIKTILLAATTMLAACSSLTVLHSKKEEKNDT